MSDASMQWFGAKRIVKNILNGRAVNPLLVGALRHLPPSPTLARIPVSVPEVEGRVAGVRYVLTNPTRCSIAKELFWGRGVRANPHEQLSLQLFVEFSEHADVAFDIGANTGVFAIAAALKKPKLTVDAFEIVPEVYEILFRNVIRNDVGVQVRCHFAGVDKDGATMRVPSTEQFVSVPLSFSANMRAESGPRVGFVSLDTLCAPLGDATRLLIKIDVEGTEGALFSNGWRAIKRLRPWIVCEILVGSPGTAELGDKLKEVGYRLFRITDHGLTESPELVADAHHRDWLFSPALAVSEVRAHTRLDVR